MRLLAGTSVFRLFPGSVQVGTDPGHELIFTGLTDEQEEWLKALGLASESDRALYRRRSLDPHLTYARVPIPVECQDLAQEIVASGLGIHCDAASVSVKVERLEEPILMALEEAIASGAVRECLIDDPRPVSAVAFTTAFCPESGRRVDTWAMSHLEGLFPELPLPRLSGHNVVIQGVPFSQSYCPSFPESLQSPVLLVHVGQVCASVGPLIVPDGKLCALCVSMFFADQRRGVFPQSWDAVQPSARTLPAVKWEVCRIIADFLKEHDRAFSKGTLSDFLEGWSHRLLCVDQQGSCQTLRIENHDDCHCQSQLFPIEEILS